MLYCYNVSVVSASSEKWSSVFTSPCEIKTHRCHLRHDGSMPVSSCPLHPLLSQLLCSQPLLYTTPSIYLASACLDLLPGSSILDHSHCPSSERVRTISVWPLGYLLNLFIPDTRGAAEPCDYANIFTRAGRLCPGCNYA